MRKQQHPTGDDTARNMMTRDVLQPILQKFPMVKATVIGDLIADRYVHATPERISREAPVLVAAYEHEVLLPGGAANTAHNLSALGVQTRIIGLLGEDAAGNAVMEALEEAGANTSGILQIKGAPTVTKTRVMIGESSRTKQQLLRLDRNTAPRATPDDRTRFMRFIQQAIADSNVMIASDYGFGALMDDVIALLRRHAGAAIIVADSRWDMGKFDGMTIITPNESELAAFCGRTWNSTEDLIAAAENARKTLHLQALLLTRGNKGMVLLEKGTPPLTFPTFSTEEAVDATGAGDTVVAALAAALAAEAGMAQASALANVAADLAVKRSCAATLTPHMILEALHHE